MNTKTIITLALAALLLTGCAGVAFSPEGAATNAVLSNRDTNFTINAVQVQQTMSINDTTSVVMLTFEGVRNGTGHEDCVYAYVVKKGNLGWQPSNGGGGCSSLSPDSSTEPLQIGAGSSGSSDPTDPGMSQVYGLVNEQSIKKVRVTWKDGQVDEVDVINHSYMAVRIGQFEMQMVEGFDAEGQPVYEFTPEVAPGKQ